MNVLASLDVDTAWQAIVRRDSTQRGSFVYGVTSTGVYCRPGCPAKLPRRDRVVFFELAAQARASGFRPCRRCRPDDLSLPQDAFVAAARQLLDEPGAKPPTLARLSARLGVSAGRLQRTFKRVTGLSPHEYALSRRFDRLKAGLRNGNDVTSSVYDAGFGSSSRVYERSAGLLGMTPGGYRAGGAGATIAYGLAPTPLGLLLLATTERGVCFVALGDDAQELQAALRKEFPAAELRPAEDELNGPLAALASYLEGRSSMPDLPLALSGTAFQVLVWKLLRSVPPGESRSYAEVAEALGRPGAARAVARACAENRLALLIPCHRVVRADGRPGGYRWGESRKQELLRLEARTKEPALLSGRAGSGSTP